MECDYRRGMNWGMDLLTTCVHDSELQVITVPPLISKLCKSQKHPLSLFQPAVFTSRSLAKASNSGDSSASRAHVVTIRRISRNWTVAPIVFKVTPRHGPRRKHSHSIVVDVFTAPLYSNGRGADHIENTFYFCMLICCRHYLVTAAGYQGTA
jgi:hypothetical protein